MNRFILYAHSIPLCRQNENVFLFKSIIKEFVSISIIFWMLAAWTKRTSIRSFRLSKDVETIGPVFMMTIHIELIENGESMSDGGIADHITANDQTWKKSQFNKIMITERVSFSYVLKLSIFRHIFFLYRWASPWITDLPYNISMRQKTQDMILIAVHRLTYSHILSLHFRFNFIFFFIPIRLRGILHFNHNWWRIRYFIDGRLLNMLNGTIIKRIISIKNNECVARWWKSLAYFSLHSRSEPC